MLPNILQKFAIRMLGLITLHDGDQIQPQIYPSGFQINEYQSTNMAYWGKAT